ncbi:MAG TPA: hypothetical protein VF669_12925 [Tepidisphaeraceae bacterium]|jgi:hypothetical protein
MSLAEAAAEDHPKRDVRAEDGGWPRWMPWAVVAVGLVFFVCVLVHLPGLNGPSWHRWQWRRLSFMWTYGLFLAAAAPMFAALVLKQSSSMSTRRVVLAATLSAFGLKLATALAQSPERDLRWIAYAVEHPDITSYYTDAVALSNFSGWFAQYDRVLPMLHLHSISKPAGPVLYYLLFVRVLGAGESTAVFAGIVTAVLSALAVPVTYALLNAITRRRNAAMYGSCFLAMCPGYALFFPMLDPLYTGLVAVILLAWVQAIERRSAWLGIATGVAVGCMTLITFNYLVIGVFMAGYALLGTDRPRAAAWKIATTQAAWALVGLIVWLLGLYLVSGYNTWTVFASAFHNQQSLMREHAAERPYPLTIWTDLVDFALGSGWIGYVMAGLWLGCAHRTDGRIRRIVWLGVAQILVVAATGLLQSETARVWNFMLPLLALPVGLFLDRCEKPIVLGVLVCEWVLLVAVCQNMKFVG